MCNRAIKDITGWHRKSKKCFLSWSYSAQKARDQEDSACSTKTEQSIGQIKNLRITYEEFTLTTQAKSGNFLFLWSITLFQVNCKKCVSVCVCVWHVCLLCMYPIWSYRKEHAVLRPQFTPKFARAVPQTMRPLYDNEYFKANTSLEGCFGKESQGKKEREDLLPPTWPSWYADAEQQLVRRMHAKHCRPGISGRLIEMQLGGRPAGRGRRQV